MVIGTPLFSFPSPLYISSTSPNTYPSSSPRRLLFPCACAIGKDNRESWGSNVEDVRTGKFRFQDGVGDRGFGSREKRQKWWSDESTDELDEEYDEFDVEPEDIWDKIWIFKVFRSYGYLLPAIIASMLLATGPKAFLMALALPLGQSVLSLAFEKLWGNESERSMPRSKAKKKPFNGSYSGFRMQEEEKQNSREKEATQDYQSWVAAGSSRSDKGEPRVDVFGGWDELDRNRDFRRASNFRSSSQAQTVKRGKLSRKGQRKETPIFIRLLIAVFPFLGSWTRLL